ncbi:MAG: hypothetical protein KF794_13705 [Xanthobacteraceae bacterium]|nr:hypothetical protein [Xanthobacteraceae bacterium]QYK44796.1 MAG: hypothetical protein KF794_13705 [Xanthobacteraceae bacterium]
MSTTPDLNAVKARIKEIENQIAALDDELEGLQIAEEVLEKLAASSTGEATKPLAPTLTVEELVLGSLKHSKLAWLTVTELRKVIQDFSGRDVPMSTLSPQVSSMTKKNQVVRQGAHVALPSRAEKEKYEDRPF